MVKRLVIKYRFIFFVLQVRNLNPTEWKMQTSMLWRGSGHNRHFLIICHCLGGMVLLVTIVSEIQWIDLRLCIMDKS